MASNFCVCLLLLALICYATMGGHNAGYENVETVEECEELFEPLSDGSAAEEESELVEETEVSSCPSDAEHAIVESEEVEMPLECGKKAEKMVKNIKSKSTSVKLPYDCEKGPTVEKVPEPMECPSKITTKKMVKGVSSSCEALPRCDTQGAVEENVETMATSKSATKQKAKTAEPVKSDKSQKANKKSKPQKQNKAENQKNKLKEKGQKNKGSNKKSNKNKQ